MTCVSFPGKSLKYAIRNGTQAVPWLNIHLRGRLIHFETAPFLRDFSVKQEKLLTNPLFVVKYSGYAKTMRKQSSPFSSQARGEGWEPLVENLYATSCVARDDRDGRSRYRAAKISAMRMN